METDNALGNKPRTVLPNTIVTDTSAPLSAALPAPDTLFVGRFDRHKGGDIALDAFEHLARTHPSARLTFAGPDPGIRRQNGSNQHLDARIRALPDDSRSRVTYVGRVDRTGVMQLRMQHPIALIASRYENLNYTLLEAMAAGQAIICTKVGGPAEILEDGQTALLVPPDDHLEMARALETLADDRALRQRLGASARALLEKDFSPVSVAARTVDFIETAVLGKK